MDDNICAVIVAYNSEENIYLNVLKLSKLVNHIIIIDNGSTNDETKRYLNKISNEIVESTIIYSGCNLGIATGLNKGCKLALQRQFKWVLTLDDDSLVDDNMIRSMLEKYRERNDEKIMILAPNITDFNGKDEGIKDGYVNAAITSGSLMNIECFNVNGWFIDEFFIDMVDIEYCYRLKKNGYRTFQVEEARLYHRLGRQKLILKIGKKEWKSLNHNEIRKYYIFRNTIQLYKKYFFRYPLSLLVSTKGVLKIFVDTVIIEEKKLPKIKMMLKGIFDGIFNKMGMLSTEKISR